MSKEQNQYKGPDFESIKVQNPYNADMWSARDIQSLLGYANWREFEAVIERAMAAAENLGYDLAQHFGEYPKTIVRRNGAPMKVKDYILSRLACYLISLNGDPHKPEISYAQGYFVTATRAYELQQLYEKQQQRLEARERFAEGHKRLSADAYSAGVKSADMALFHDEGYRGMYGGLGAAEIKQRKKVDPDEDLPDRMGLDELNANAFRQSLSHQMMNQRGVNNPEEAFNTNYEAGTRVRDTIREAGVRPPEDLPAEPTIRRLFDSFKRGQKKLKKGEQPEDPGNPKQGSLF